jgi:tetratricopeptide (TPR) repeat protein
MLYPVSDSSILFSRHGALTGSACSHSETCPRAAKCWKYALISICLIFCGACGSSPKTYADRGKRFFDEGKFDDAALQYQKAIQKSPQFGDAYYRLALTELKRNQPIPAYHNLRRALELDPGNEDVSLRFGQLALTLYNADPQHPQALYTQALKSATDLLSKKPGGYGGNLLKGALSLLDRKPSEGIEYLRKAIVAKPGDPDATLGLARALVLDNQAQAGIDLAEELVRNNKTYGLAYDFLFGLYQSSGKVIQAENALKLKLANNPKDRGAILELARYYAATRRPSDVASTLQRLLADSVTFPDGRAIAGDFYVGLGNPNEALAQYSQGLQSSSKNKNLYRKAMARILSAQRKWPEASEQVDAILKEKPDDQEGKLMRALIWLDEGKPEKLDLAMAELRAQQVRRPDDATLHFQIGNGLARKNDAEGARREWAAAARLGRDYVQPRLALIQLNLAQGKSQDALQIADELSASAPRNSDVALLHAICLTEAGQYQRARTELNKLQTQAPQSALVRYRLASLALAEGKFKDAEDLFAQLLKSSPGDPQLLAGMAGAYRGEKQPEKGLRFLQAQVAQRPDSQPLRQLLGRYAAGTGQYDVAIEQYEHMSATGSSPEDQLALAAAYIAKGDKDRSISVLTTLVDAQPKLPTALLQLARTLAAAGRTQDAKVRYRSLLAIEPNEPSALNDLAYLMADSNENLTEARALAERGAKNASDPGLKVALSDTMGWIYLKQNQYDAALQTFQQLTKSNPANPTFRYHLGATLFQSGSKQKARTELEAALAAKPEVSDEARIRELLARI